MTVEFTAIIIYRDTDREKNKTIEVLIEFSQADVFDVNSLKCAV